MVKKKSSLSSRLVSMLLATLILVGMITPAMVNTFAVTDSFATIETLVSGGTVTENVVIFDNCELNWSPADFTVGRSVDGWWVGIKVTAPADADIDSATYQNQSGDGWGAVKSFKTYRDSNDASETQYITLWGVVNEAHLNDAIINGKEYLEYGYQFDWNGDGVYEQPISMRIVPGNIKLMKDGSQVYPKASGLAEADVITSGITANGNGGNIVVVENTVNVTLDWHEKNEAIGRTEDGWWIGYHVVAPDGADLTKATYQYKTASGWDTTNTRSFDQYKDTPNSIQVWRLVNEQYLNAALANNKAVNYITRYDWDGDGVYEQIVHLKINPKKVTLVKDGEQVYPYLGTITPLTGGTVSGNTSNTQLTIEETTLNWSPKDESIGRYTDGWWVGMRLTAPEGYDVNLLKNATYKTRVTSAGGTAWTEYSANKSFWAQKDSKDTEASQYIGLWMVVTPALISAYQNNGTTIKTEYVFDWNGDGTADQTVTLAVVPSDKIVLNKVEQQGFAFADGNPTDKWVGEAYTNTASGGKGTGAVSYAIVSGADVADIDANTGKLTFKKVGIVKVEATKAADDTYKAATATYTVTAVKKAQDEFKFQTSNPDTIGFNKGSYENTVVGGSGNGEVTYSISDKSVATIDKETGKVTFIKAGKVTVTAVKAEDDLYLEETVTYTLTIEKSNQEELSFNATLPETITYSPNAQNVLPALKGGSGTGAVTYSIASGSEYAAINKDTGAITIKKAGGAIVVKVQKAGDDGYNAYSFNSDEITVVHAAQTGFKFEKVNPAKVTYDANNNSFSNKADGGESTGEITYAFKDAESDEIADIDAQTGEITILAAGTLTVVATKAGDDCYNAITAEYSLTVEKATPDFKVEDVDLIYGVEEYQISKTEIKPGSGEYTYSVSANDIGATVDADGKISFAPSEGKVGSVTVTVKQEADDRYNELEKTFTLTVSYLETDAMPSFDGEKINNSGWYTDNITITAPAGYLISYDNSLSAVWNTSVPFETENKDGKKTVYLKNDDGITDGILLSGLLLDKTSPAELSVEYTTKAWERFLQVVTFGYYNPTEVVVTLIAKDSTSGIEAFTFNYTDSHEDGKADASEMTVDADGTAKYSFTVSVDYRNKIKFSAFDVSGRETVFEDDKELVVDFTAPVLNVSYAFDGANREENNIIYTNDSATVKFEIAESNFDISLVDDADKPKVYLDGNPISVTWTQDTEDGVWSAECKIATVGEHIVSIEYTDMSKNRMETYQKEIRLEETKPIIGVEYTGTAVKDNIFDESRTATVKVTERNFKADEVELIVTAKNIKGEAVDISAKEYSEYAKNPANWTQNGDVWTLNTDGMKFDVDAIYEVTVNYTDLAFNKADEYKNSFVVDTFVIDSQKIAVEYSQSIVDRVLEAVTFGFYKGDVTVTVTAEDITSGVDTFEIFYNPVDGKNNSNKPAATSGKLVAVQDDSDKSVFTASYTISADVRGTVSVQLTDNAANSTQKDENYVVVADTIAPGLKYNWEFTDDQVREYNDIYFTQNKATVNFTIEEANFDLSLITAEDETEAPAPVLTVNGVREELVWTQIDGTDEWKASATLTGNGDYKVVLTYADSATNDMETYEKVVHIDNEAPVFEVSYDNNDARNENNYKADRTATIKVTEHNFKPDEVELTVTAQDINGKTVDISSKAYKEYAKNPANWTQDGDVWTLNTDGMEFDIEAIYSVTLDYTDLAENAADTYTADFVVDKTITKSEDITVEYSKSIVDKILETVTFGFYKSNVEVTVTVKDETAGIETVEVLYNAKNGRSNSNKADFTSGKLVAVQDGSDKSVFTATFTVSEDIRGTVSVEVTDKAGNVTRKNENYVVVIDTIVPGFDCKWEFTDNQVREYNDVYYTKNKATVYFTIDEANFDLSLITAEDETEAPAPVLTVNGVREALEWIQIEGTDKWEACATLTGNGDYELVLTYTDRSTNAMETYEKVVHIDNEAPVFEVTYDNNDARNENNYKADRTATVKVTEHNFKADEVELTVTAQDINGNTVDISSKAYKEYAKNPTNWMYKAADGQYVSDVILAENADEHYLVLPEFDIEAIYSVTLDYTDLAENKADTYTADFVVDKTITKAEDIKVSYSKTISDRILEAITFGLYKADVIVTVTIKDETAGIETIEIFYNAKNGKNNSNTPDFTSGKLVAVQDSGDKSVFTATYTIKAPARGTVSVEVIDNAGNISDTANEEKILVVDEISATREVIYKPSRILKPDGQGNITVVDNFAEGDDTVLYFKGEALITFKVTEANFDLSLKANEAPVITVNDAPVTVEWNQESGTDIWTATYTITDDGDYVVKMSYKDLSTNEMVAYESQRIVVDGTAPEVSVDYSDDTATNKVDAREYYTTERTAVITVKEHNFLADDFKLLINAQDVNGKEIAAQNVILKDGYLSQGAKRAEWTAYSNGWRRVDDTYQLTVKFATDANYTVDVEYSDIAGNKSVYKVSDEASVDDYEKDLFTIDRIAPTDLEITYAKPVFWKEVLETITFGYYNAKTTVTITAFDDISGIHYFSYSYIKGENVSKVNAELKNELIEEANKKIVHEDGTYKFETSFEIPKLELDENNQFNGTVSFIAFDRALNNTEEIGTHNIVVDNISPTSTITYNQPVQKANDISYYAGNIDAKIVINEANFYSDGATVKVTKDGVDYPVTVKWVDDSVDVHTGTFTLKEDGDYIVTVEYADRSGNAMPKYTSNRLTLDTKLPAVNVTNIKYNSANKDEKYGFTITANDINLDSASFTPILNATVRNEDGSYATKVVSLGEMKTVEEGKTYTFTVDNLKEDAIYSLICTVKDMSGNTYSKLTLSDNKEYEDVRFSINRNGSTFGVDANTDKLVNQYYVYKVNNDVVIEEINVDAIQTYAVKLNGKALTEGSDYKTTLTENSGEWSKRTYIISKDNFKAEGEYDIVVESTDKTETNAYSDVKNLKVSFVVDQTAPMLTITGLENKGRYQVEEQTVTVIPTDDGGRLSSMKIIVLDSDGKPLKDDNGKDISVRFDMSGEEFLTYLTENDSKVVFTIPEGLELQVRIICDDQAVNADGDTNLYDVTYKKVTVSQSGWVIFYAYKPVFYGSIAGVLLLVGGIILLIVLKKRKKTAK